jgi:hypothetical protein
MATLLTGCFAEDYGFCPQNVVLNYRLPDDKALGGCSFLDRISTVTTSIYDMQGRLVQSVTTDDADHVAFKGARLWLEPGTYRVVSWGNSGSHTSLPVDNDRPFETVTYNTISNGTTGDGDALYYAPRHTRDSEGDSNGVDRYVMVVDPVNGHRGTLDFRHAHRRIEVYVRGFDHNGNTAPRVRLTGLPAGLTYHGMNSLEENTLVDAEVDTEMVRITRPGYGTSNYALSPFHVFYLDAEDYDIGVDLLDPTSNQIVYSTRINDHIDPKKDDPENQIVIRILIEFLSLGVQVSVPGWMSEDVTFN